MGANKRRKRMPSFVGLPREMLKNPEWRTGLSNSAKILYVHLKHKYVGWNNGEIVLHYSEVMDFMSKSTICRAFKELEEKGWIERMRKIGGEYRFTVQYSLTGNHDPAIFRYGF